MLRGENPKRVHEMAGQGTTTVEAKSGYGLSLDSEIKSLEAIETPLLNGLGQLFLHCLALILFRQISEGAPPNTSILCAMK